VEALKQEHPGVRLHVTRASSGHIVVHQIVVPGEKRSQGIGGRIMKRLTDAADRNGDSMALTPSKDYGGTVSRLQTFYRGHGFVPNSGRNKDYTTRESMIREPKKQ
jgi:predicted GNAT family N-acyltransferase